jgi:hypothetical protein
MKTPYLAAQAFSGADFMYGPLVTIDEPRPVIAGGPGGRAMRPVLDRLAPRGLFQVTREW